MNGPRRITITISAGQYARIQAAADKLGQYVQDFAALQLANAADTVLADNCTYWPRIARPASVPAKPSEEQV